ncbi:MAG TPA: hypothetical protein VFL57_15295 [Bryobacteraceae bacterium]|nr:hypothetical protein [Bryobacteraceae bacterium]
MHKLFFCLALTASALVAEYKTEPTGAPPADLNASVVSLLGKQGLKISDGSKVVAEVWFRSSMPTGGKAEDMKALPDVPMGALMGAIRFPANWSDRRGQQIKAGVYTMRYGLFPQNGDHQGVAPQRDFLLLIRAADDTNGAANLDYNELTKTSMKAAGSPHPAVFSIWKADAADFRPGISQAGEHDQVLKVRIGDTPLAMIIYGKAEG